MSLLPFFPQEHPESCVPACLRMLLAYYGITRTEAELYTCCRSDIDGTLASAAAGCAESLNFDSIAVRLPDLDSLYEQLDIGYVFPIIYMNLTPILGINIIHAMILVDVNLEADQVQLVDPAYPPKGRRILSTHQFELSWRLARGQSILVKPVD